MFKDYIKFYIANMEDRTEDERIVNGSVDKLEDLVIRLNDKLLDDPEIRKVVDARLEYHLYQDEFMKDVKIKNDTNQSFKRLLPSECNHIDEIWDYLDQFKTKEELEEAFGDIPSKFGSFEIVNWKTYKEEGYFELCNSYWDKNTNDFDYDYHCIYFKNEEDEK